MKTKNNFSMIFALMSLILSAHLSAHAQKKSGKMSVEEFRVAYPKVCATIAAIPENTRSKFCDCMTAEYVKKSYTDKKTLELLKKAYEGKLPPNEKLSDFEKLLIHFDGKTAELCLEEVSH